MLRKITCLSCYIILCFYFQMSLADDSFVLNSYKSDYAPFQGKLQRDVSILKMNAVLAMPVSEDTVPVLLLRFPGNKEEYLTKITISDEVCTGEYNSQVTFLPNSKEVQLVYFDGKIPWPETVEIIFIANNKSKKRFKHILTINGEKQMFHTHKKLKNFEIDVDGKVEIEQLEVFNEDDRRE